LDYGNSLSAGAADDEDFADLLGRHGIVPFL